MLTLKTLRDLPLLSDEAGRTIDLGKQEMSLLVYCVVAERRESRTKDAVGELLSTRSNDKRALIDTYLSRLGKKLPGECVASTDPLQFTGIECDAVQLRALADDHRAPGEPVLTLYEGEFLRFFHGAKHAADFSAWRDRTAGQLRKTMEILWEREMRAELAKRETDWNRVRELAIWGLKVDRNRSAGTSRL